MKDMNKIRPSLAKDVEAVVTSFNQGTMVLEAVQSLCEQTPAACQDPSRR